MKTLSLELVLFSWLAYNIFLEIHSWFDKEEVAEVPPAVERPVVPITDEVVVEQ